MLHVDGAARPTAGWDTHVHVFDGQAPTAPGHYRPVHRPLADIEALARRHGIEHLVLVQPSVYGTDNTVLLDALRSSPGRHRGVVVTDASVSDATLQAMHAVGVRGLRFNLVSPVGSGDGADTLATFHALVPRLSALGWHVQWYAHPQHLPVIAALHGGSAARSVPAVLDHLAGLHADLRSDDAAWSALAELAQRGAWVKLSGWYRLKASAPYGVLDSAIRQVAALFDMHMVWGSDWPHTAFAPDAIPAYASTLEPVERAVSAAQRRHVWALAPSTLYA